VTTCKTRASRQAPFFSRKGFDIWLCFHIVFSHFQFTLLVCAEDKPGKVGEADKANKTSTVRPFNDAAGVGTSGPVSQATVNNSALYSAI
jgi:hypothetical protein